MAFVQTIEVHAADGTLLREHLASWHAEQSGLAPGYQLRELVSAEPRYANYRLAWATSEGR